MRGAVFLKAYCLFTVLQNSKEMKESENFNEGSYPTKSFDHQHNTNESKLNFDLYTFDL